ncbi:MAG: hypothetical protein KGI49_03890, partial [Patescibacteria group bacterium]|nr:hypothetical protein [Patescibacteria group bacterium]
GKGGGEIKVWGIGQAGATGTMEQKNSTISRVTFGIDVSEKTKIEKQLEKERFESQFKKIDQNQYL